jgi:hypothetical protein
MIRYVVKNERGEYVRQTGVVTFGWTPKRSKRFQWYSKPKAWECARELGGKVYRLRKTSAKRERRQAVGYLRALCGTWMFMSSSAALHAAANGIESGEHLAWRAPKEAK